MKSMLVLIALLWILLSGCTNLKKINSTCMVLNGSTCIYIDEENNQSIVDCAGFVCMKRHEYIEFIKSCNQ